MKAATTTTLAAKFVEKETLLSERIKDFAIAWLLLELISFAYMKSFVKLVVVNFRPRGDLPRDDLPEDLQCHLHLGRREERDNREGRVEGVGEVVVQHRNQHQHQHQHQHRRLLQRRPAGASPEERPPRMRLLN